MLDRLPIKARIIAFDETENWELDTCPFKEHIARIEGVYIYDANQHTYCCESTPSYWLECLENREVITEETWNLPNVEEIRDAINNWIMGAERASEYVHVSSVDKAFTRKLSEHWQAAEMGEYDYISELGDDATAEEIEQAYREKWEEILDSAQCNARI